jgi:hypothetical protein
VLRQQKKTASRFYFHPDQAFFIDGKMLQGGAARWAEGSTIGGRPRPEIVVTVPRLVVSGAESTEARSSAAVVTSADAEIRRLTERVRFLEAELRTDRPYLQLYRLGASSLLVSALSLMVWALTGIGIPFHPIFAGCVIPASLGVIAMAFLIRPREKSK